MKNQASFQASIMIAALLLFCTWVSAQGRWLPTGGPEGGQLFSVATHPSNPKVLFVGGYACVFKSVDGGESWARSAFGTSNITQIVFDPITLSTVYAITAREGVFKSVDAGVHWVPRNVGLTNLSARSLAIDPSDPTTLYVGTYGGGVFKSSDAGLSWVEASNGITDMNVNSLAIDPTQTNVLYVVSYFGSLYRSVDAAQTWTGIPVSFRPSMIRAAVGPADSLVLYAASPAQVIRSLDGGENWQLLETTTETILDLRIHPADPSLLYVLTPLSLFRSRDGGVNWTKQGFAVQGRQLAVSSAQTHPLFVATFGLGALRSEDDGSNWVSANHGLVAAQVTSIGVGTASEGEFAATLGGGVYQNLAGNWIPINDDDLAEDLYVWSVLIDSADPETLYVGTNLSGILVSHDTGLTWNASNDGLPTLDGLGGLVYPLEIRVLVNHPTDPTTLYAGSQELGVGGVYQSSDSGRHWDLIGMEREQVECILIQQDDPATMYVGTLFHGVFKTTDGGNHWAQVALGNDSVFSLAFDSVDRVVYAGSQKVGVVISNDDGGTWTPANHGLPSASIQALSVDPLEPGRVYAGTWGSGVFISSDSGESWAPMNNGLTNPWTTSMEIDPRHPGGLILGTKGGVFRFEAEPLRLNFAQFSEGEDLLSSQVLLLNPSATVTAHGNMSLRQSDGNPLSVDLNGVVVHGDTEVSVPPGGLQIFESDGLGPIVTGSVSAFSDQALAGVVVFGGSVGLAGVGGSRELTHGFIAPVRQDKVGSEWIRTGIAVMNLEGSATALDLKLRDRAGVMIATGQLELAGLGQSAKFLDEMTWDNPIDLETFEGTLEVGSAQRRIAATVIQQRPDEFATMPVAPIPETADVAAQQAESTTLHFAQFAEGQGILASRILLANLDRTGPAHVDLSLRQADGSPLTVDLNGAVVSGQSSLTIPPAGLATLETDGLGPVVSGSVSVSSDRPLAGVVVFGGSVGLAGVSSSEELTGGFLAPIITKSDGGIRTGIAVMNLEETATTLTLELQNSDGEELAMATLELPSLGQSAKFADEFQWDSPVDFTDFQGTLEVTSNGRRIAATVIQQRPGRFATMPVAAK